MSKRFMVLLIAFSLMMIPVVNAQNVHGWTWAVNVGDLNEYEMTIRYETIDSTRDVYINITSLGNLSAISAVSDIEIGYEVMNTDYSDLDTLRASVISSFFEIPVALPVGNWEVIGDNTPGLMGSTLAYLVLLVDAVVIENSTYFGFNIGYNESDVYLTLNTTWYKSDGLLKYYNITFNSDFADVNLIMDKVEPPAEPSTVDKIITFVTDNLLLVVGVVAVLCIIAGIANKK